MADYSPTIIAASLNDKELKSAIDKLVEYVDKGALKMAENFNAGVELMRESLQSLGNKNIANNIFSHAKAHNEVTKALEKEAIGYDNLERAISRSVGRRGTKHDYVKLDSDVDNHLSYVINVNKDVNAQLQQMIENEQKLIQEKEREAQVTREIQQARQAEIARGGVSGASLGWFDVNKSASESRKLHAQQESTKAVTHAYSELEKVISTYLGISEQELNIQIKKNGSYVTLSESLKKMTAAYAEMTKEERNSGAGRNLAENIQRVQRAAQQAQAQMSRPVSLKSALGIDEKTLDDITYKIQMLQRYRSGIDITKPNASKELDSVNKAIAELTKKQRELLGTNKTLLESNNALARSWNYMKNRLAFYFTVGASTAFVKNLIEVRSQYELLERSMGILFDSMQTGTKIFAELNAMALKSPFTTMELGSAAKQLSAYNIAAKDVVDTTRRLADMAAAVGIPIERLTYALGQIKSYGYLNSRDQRMFANAGIPLVQSLADMYSKLEGRLVSMGDVYDRIKKKQVSFEDTMRVINEMTDEGGRFFDFQAKSADTLKVRLANLTLAWNNMLNELGKDNQGVISGMIGGAKVLFDNWRKINNVIVSIITEIGVLKGLQLLILALNKKLLVQKEVELVLGKKITQTIWNTVAAMKVLAVNPMTWLTLVATTLTYMAWQWYDIKKAAEEFNKTIAKNAQENIDSINKFYSQYAKDIETVTSLQQADQQKLWERVREEIEKTSKNARQYIDILESTPNIADRVIGGKETLDQIRIIEEEVERLSEKDIFNIGGGFANDSLAEDLTDYEETVKSIAKNYKSLQDALNWHWNYLTGKDGSGFAGLPKYWKLDAQVSDIQEANSELDKFVAKLGSADLQRVMGSGDAKTQIANLREFAHIIRDNFLATEQGQKVGVEGQAKLNASLDRWITLQAKAKNLLDDEQISIELHRSAWEKFFDTLNEEERERVDYLVRTNQLGSDEFQKIWDNAAEHLKKSSETSYQQIQEQIADLRGTAPIVIDVIYKERREQKDAQQEAFEADLITPKGVGVLTAEKYFDEVNKLRAKYERFNKKEGEDNVDWEKRLGEEYQRNANKIENLNNQLENSATLSEIDREAKENDRDSLVGINDVLKQIEKREGFDYSQFAKDGKSKKDELGDALTKELQLITDIQKLYKEYTNVGIDSETAKTAAAKEYQKTLEQTNNTLSKFGIQWLTGEQIATMDLRSLRDNYQSILDKVQSSPKAVEALEKAIRNLNIEITKQGQKTIIDSLNSELSKIKDEYELAVDLDANPELGENFATMFGIVPEALPHTIQELAERMLNSLNDYLKKGKQNLQLPSLFLTPDDINILKELVQEKKLGEDYFKAIMDSYNKFVGLLKSASTDVEKVISDYIKNYGDLSERLKEIENEKNENLKKLNAEYYTDELKQTEEYAKKRNIILDKANKDTVKATFEAFKKSDDYERFFMAIDTLTEEDATKIKKEIKKNIVEAFKGGALNVQQFRKEIKALETQFDSLTKATSVWGAFMQNGFDGAIKRAKEVGQELEYIGEKIKVENKIDEKDKNYLNSLGKIFTGKDGSSTNFSGLMEQFGKDMNGLGNSVSSAGSGMNSAAGKFASTVAVIDTIVKNIHGMVEGINQIFNELNEGRNEDSKIGGWGWDAFSKVDQYAASGWEKLKSGNIMGATTDTISSIIAPIVAIFRKADKDITDKIKKSELEVEKLGIAYDSLSDKADKAYGVLSSGARRAAIENKRLQLAEVQRQLQLEKSRAKKYQDEDKIVQLEGKVESLRREINNTTSDVINDMLGISSAGDGVTNLVQVMIDAFKQGENAMTAFGDEWDKMIDNMILRLIISKYVQDTWDNIMKTLKNMEDEMLGEVSGRAAKAESEMIRIRNMSDEEFLNEFFSNQVFAAGEDLSAFVAAKKNALLASYEATWNEANSELRKLSEQFTEESLKYLAGDAFDTMKDAVSKIPDELKKRGIAFGEDAEGKLQQGIQGITEDTAGALEAYMNGVSQQVYLHSDLLTQIRDAVVGFDLDVQLGVQSQILLELQNSYQVQMSIQNILQGVLTPSGRAFMVEME